MFLFGVLFLSAYAQNQYSYQCDDPNLACTDHTNWCINSVACIDPNYPWTNFQLIAIGAGTKLLQDAGVTNALDCIADIENGVADLLKVVQDYENKNYPAAISDLQKTITDVANAWQACSNVKRYPQGFWSDLVNELFTIAKDVACSDLDPYHFICDGIDIVDDLIMVYQDLHANPVDYIGVGSNVGDILFNLLNAIEARKEQIALHQKFLDENRIEESQIIN